MKPTTRKELALMVPNGGVMIELGVAAGKFAAELLMTNPRMYYIGIDRWSDHHDNAEMEAATIRLSEIGADDRFSIFRLSFRNGLEVMEDGHADLVYVDGYAHTGQEGGQTLRDWWPKLKPGGIFAGHDYDAEYPLTVKAVDEFVAEHGLELNVIEEKPNSSWWVKKPA